MLESKWMRMCQKHIGSHLKRSYKQNLGQFDTRKNDSNHNTLNGKRICKSVMLLKKKKNLPQYKEENKGEKIVLSSRLVAKNVERMVMIFTSNWIKQ